MIDDLILCFIDYINRENKNPSNLKKGEVANYAKGTSTEHIAKGLSLKNVDTENTTATCSVAKNATESIDIVIKARNKVYKN